MLSWLERIAGTVLWLFLVVVKWFQAQFVHPVAQWWFDTVLATWEESIKSVIRELFSQVLRVVNTVVNALFGWFPGYQSVRTTHQKPSAWQAWFEENRPGTLNDIIKRDTSVTGEDSYCSEQTDQTTGSYLFSVGTCDSVKLRRVPVQSLAQSLQSY